MVAAIRELLHDDYIASQHQKMCFQQGGTSLTNELTQETSGSSTCEAVKLAAVVAGLLLLRNPKEADFLSLFSSSP
jgi:hypothetical protein